ncbi:hypothetical protein EHV10_07485 [Lachnoanaerobaculum gingivalis]|jgi:hypothetical protein|uniref:Uncharacterized protein n=1 Tax=Lachnoanaerobaculum gingivalis TaxID=2490855 RepID=A0A3P3QYS0_9FIRM|nr:hypothetical protein [Lachnoanaerobaculum gingivalis]RRJ25473.1 hypothetical protein EHV10_07485 [Lachnoanaerobaculum gingivalis]
MNKKPIFEIIADRLRKTEFKDDDIITLGKDFSLPNDEEGLKYIDGAKDGICAYHMGVAEITKKDIEEINTVITFANKGDYDQADSVLEKLCERIRVINFIDELQDCILARKDEIEDKFYIYSLHLMTQSANIECVKVGMIIQELFKQSDEVKGMVRTLGLSDEFTLYSVFIMRNWENGNTEIMNIAKSVNGWGKVHAVHYIEPDTEEIKYWLLTGAVSNGVMPAYSGWDCYKKADVEAILKKDRLTYEELEGVLSIVDAILDEGPVLGISNIENPKEILSAVLNHSIKHLPLSSENCKVISNILDWQKENLVDENCEIELLANQIFEAGRR